MLKHVQGKAAGLVKGLKEIQSIHRKHGLKDFGTTNPCEKCLGKDLGTKC